MPKPLKGRAGLSFGQIFLPKNRARHQFDDALALQQIKRNNHWNGSGEEESGWSQEVHLRAEFELGSVE